MQSPLIITKGASKIIHDTGSEPYANLLLSGGLNDASGQCTHIYAFRETITEVQSMLSAVRIPFL